MKPNFALSLSQDGIQLWHQTADGLALVGETDFATGDLGAALGDMRTSALRLEPDGLHCKVVIPNDQIRYLKASLDDSLSAAQIAEAALEGATPYAVSDLAFDTNTIGDTVQVAAIARETLAEAEEFAKQNQFNPICFVAEIADHIFVGEPVFFAHDMSGQSKTETGDDTNFGGAEFEQPSGGESDEQTPQNEIDAAEDVSFVSQRTVPTFRTEPQDEWSDTLVESTNGFAETQASYKVAATDKIDSKTKRTQRASSDEATKMTVFGARDTSALAGRRDSLIRVAAVVAVVSLGITGFASGIFSNGWTAIFDRSAGKAPELRFAAPIQPALPPASEAAPADLPSEQPPTRDPALTDEDVAVLDALAAPSPELPDTETTAEPQPPKPRTDYNDVDAYYAVYGIWPKAPEVPRPSALVDLNDFYVSGADTDQPQFDAVALPTLTSYRHDEPLLPPSSPAPAGTQFTLDENSMVVPTPQGALNPDGITVIAGTPPARPPETLVRLETPGDDLERRIRLSAFRPEARPEGLVEPEQDASIDAARLEELATLRPRMRPSSAQEDALAAASLVSLDTDGALIREQSDAEILAPNARAVRASLRPDARPSNMDQIVARAQRSAPVAATTASAARVAPRVVTPSIPSSASTAREATQRNAINLRKVNLIGVYGTPSSRRALVRLGNGRYQKVAVGDRIDGGRVSAIGESELRYQKSGRAVVLKMPSS